MHSFDKDYWEQHWDRPASGDRPAPPNPSLVDETRELPPGTALDAGCGEGAEAIWLAARGWRVTGADLSGTALATAADRAEDAAVADRVTWVETDLTSWDPRDRWDLVVTNYAHPAMPQPAFYRRIAEWVAPEGTLLIVGHLHDSAAASPGHHPPPEATASLAGITSTLDPAAWRIDTARERTRTLVSPGGGPVLLRDAIVRATRVS